MREQDRIDCEVLHRFARGIRAFRRDIEILRPRLESSDLHAAIAHVTPLDVALHDCWRAAQPCLLACREAGHRPGRAPSAGSTNGRGAAEATRTACVPAAPPGGGDTMPAPAGDDAPSALLHLGERVERLLIELSLTRTLVAGALPAPLGASMHRLRAEARRTHEGLAALPLRS